jgi:hypothetical protein
MCFNLPGRFTCLGDRSDIAGTGLGIGARRDTERLRRRRVRGAAVRRHRARKSRDGKRTSLFARALAASTFTG